MKKTTLNITHFFWIIFIIILLSSCGKNYQAHLIPKNTEIVTKLNTEQLFFKIDNWQEMLNQTFIQKTIDNPYQPELHQQLGNSGINFFNIYFFGNFTNTQENYFGFLFALNNHKQFEDFLEENYLRHEIRRADKINYIERYQSILAWNKKSLLFLGAKNNEQVEELTQKAKDILNGHLKESLYHNSPNFKNFVKQKTDFSLWCNLQELLQNSSQEHNFVNNLDLEGQFLNTFTRFKKGNFKTDIKYFLSNQKNNRFQKLLQNNINHHLLENSYKSNPLVVLGMSLDMPKLEEILKKEKIDLKIDSIAGHLGFSSEEFLGMLAGDFVIILQEIAEVSKNIEKRKELTNELYYVKKLVKEPQLAFGFTVRNQKTYQKLKKMALKSNLMLEEKGYYSIFQELFLIEKGNTVFVTMSKIAKNELLKQVNTDELNQKLVLQGKENALTLYMRKEFLEIFRKPNQKLNLADFPLDYLSFSQSDFTKHLISNGKLTLEFIDKNENALNLIYQTFKEVLQEVISQE